MASLFPTAELSAGPARRASREASQSGSERVPWYRSVYRWGQTNITEADPATYDIDGWREHWKRTRVGGVIVNAAGIVAYYPSASALQYRPPSLGDRDLYGDLVRAAHADGLAVLARMDSNRVHEEFSRARPDWMARDAHGNPYRSGGLYITCINSGYYNEWIPNLLREIVQQSHPEGFTDNSWAGLGRNNICYCANCERQFRTASGSSLPPRRDWDDPVYGRWIEWNYARRLEIWDLNNRATRQAGGPDCLWIGMISGSVTAQAESFRDCSAIAQRAEMLLLDHQSRSDSSGFQQNGQTGKLIHGLLGWDKLLPESMAMYQAGRPTFRKASKPEPEARLWVLEGFAGTIQPWWHHVGAQQEDRRQFRIMEPLNRWHERHESYLIQRRPIASVGVVWSQRNTDFYGRDNPEELVDLPLRGLTQALLRARIPYIMVHADHIARDAADLALLVLPNLAIMSDRQVDSVRQFAMHGGGLLLTDDTGLFQPSGERRSGFALRDLTGAGFPQQRQPPSPATRVQRATETVHTYLRLPSDLKARHPVLRGFEETNLLPFGGLLEELDLEADVVVPLTFVPAFPIYPPETSWMREPKTSIPGLVLRTLPSGSRVAYLAADLDRRFARDNLPDHGDLLANLVRWAAQDRFPLRVSGPGMIDCHLYRQANRLILHLVNLSNAGTWRQPVEELLPVGPLQVSVQVGDGIEAVALRLLVTGTLTTVRRQGEWVQFELPHLLDHEVAVIE